LPYGHPAAGQLEGFCQDRELGKSWHLAQGWQPLSRQPGCKESLHLRFHHRGSDLRLSPLRNFGLAVQPHRRRSSFLLQEVPAEAQFYQCSQAKAEEDFPFDRVG
jgi:hypothetical protein